MGTPKAGRRAQKHPQVSSAALKGLQKRLDYTFKDEGLLAQALTHASAETRAAGLKDNERFEFLGDRILGLLTADALTRTFPEASEGDLATRLNALVRRETLAEVAGEIGLGKCLVLGSGEDQAGGRQKPALLADACEALFAALYRDGGMRAAKRFFETYWKDRLSTVAGVQRDAKTRLQEWAQGAGHGTPVYTPVSRIGPDHAPTFTIEVRVKGLKSRRGKGASKREAEQMAAEALLKSEGVDD
jgi:ribonuclease-3